MARARSGVAEGFGWLAALLASFVAPPRALALDAEVSASLEAQYYTLRSAWDTPELRRRRYTETLGLSLFDIHPRSSPRGPRLSFRSQLRLSADYGQDPSERDPSRARYVPGLEEAPLDLMYAYLEGERYLGGVFGFRLGRQYQMDTLGFWSFDGLSLSLVTPAHLSFEIYGGAEQRGGGLNMFGTRRFEAQGVWRGDRSDLELDQYPFFLNESELAPALGVAVETFGLGPVRSRLSYRRVVNRDRVLISPFAASDGSLLTFHDARTSSERLGYMLRADAPALGSASGSLVYDFYAQAFSSYQVSVSAYVGPRFTLGADYDYFLPTFDGDSIFTWFSHSPTSSAFLRAEARLWRKLELAFSGGVRWFETAGRPAAYAAASAFSRLDRGDTARLFDLVLDGSGRYAFPDGAVTLRAEGESGDRGHRLGADLTTRRSFASGRYDGLSVVSLWDFDDPLRRGRHATSFGYVLGAGVTPGPAFFSRSRFGVEWEHDINRLVGQRFRVLATLDLTVLD